MDYVKIQAEAIKRKSNNSRVYEYKKDGCIYLSVNGAAIFIIPEEAYFLDLRETPFPKMMQIFSEFNIAHHTPVELSNDRYCSDGKMLVAFKAEEHTVWFDEKILKKFGALSQLKIVSAGELSPAGVYDIKGNIIGIISPCRILNYGKSNQNK